MPSRHGPLAAAVCLTALLVACGPTSASSTADDAVGEASLTDPEQTGEAAPNEPEAALTDPPAGSANRPALDPTEGAVPAPSDTPFAGRPLTSTTTTSGYDYADDDRAAWREQVPGVVDREIPSADGQQPAMWLDPDSEDQPLLVVLHSWSTGYEQQLSIPYARWAADNGWAMVAPNYRGDNGPPQTTGSALSIRDVRTAVKWALAESAANPEHVAVVGFSGGAMMALLLAAEAPGTFAAAMAWVPVHDLPAWYPWTVDNDLDLPYDTEIEQACGGPPRPGTAAFDDCTQRSPSSTLAGIAEDAVPIYIGVGIDDEVVPVSQGASSFNLLAREQDRLGDDALATLDAAGVPPDLTNTSPAAAHFTDDDPGLLGVRTSRNTTFAVFDGGHEMLYGPSTRWLASLELE